MAVRIQLRRDTAANWISNNPTLREGEIGIETDTLKMKVGNGSSTWTQITNYANVVPSNLNTTLNGYVEVTDIGAENGVAGLNGLQNLLIPNDSIIFEGATDDGYETTLTVTDPTADRTITFPDSTGTVALAENVAALSGATFTGNIAVPTAITFEGATADSYETIIQVTDPTADRTITIPNVSGTVVTTGDTASVSNTMLANSAVTINGYTINLGSSATYGTDNISEGTTNLYFTNERAQDAVATALNAGTHTNISVSYDDNANSISLTGAVTYTDENAQDAVGNAVGNGLDYNDSTGAISVDPSEFALSAVGNPTADVSMASYKITNLATPESSTDAATKAYVDNTTAGLNFHAAVHAATSTNITTDYNNGTSGVGATLTAMSNGAIGTVDGHQVVLNDRILVKSQTDAAQNGIYYVSNAGGASSKWVLTRALDADNSPAGEIAYGDFCFVQNGTTQGGYGYIVNTTGTITIGTTAINYTQFNAAQSVTAGNGLSEPSSGTLAIDTSITADLSTAQTFTNKTLTSPKINEDVALTATATELNILDGATLSTTELNYVDGVTSAIQTQLDGKQAVVSGVSSTEIGYLDGVTSAIQTQLDSKLSTSTASSTYQPLVSGVSDTEIGYLDGVTSSIQTQLDAKIAKSLVDAKGDILVGSADNTVARLGIGTNGYLLTANSSATNGLEWAAAPVSLPTQTDQAGKYLTTDGTTASWATLVVPIETGTATVSSNTATTIDTTALSAFTSIEYMVSLKQGSKVRTSKVVVQTDGTSVDMTEFAITETGGTIAGVVVSASVSSTNAVLQLTATDAASTNVAVKFSKVKL